MAPKHMDPTDPDSDPQHWLPVPGTVLCSVADPWHFDVDPDPWLMDPDPAIFVIELQDANRKQILVKENFCLSLFEGTFT